MTPNAHMARRNLETFPNLTGIAELAIAADAQFPVDFFVLGRSYRRIFVVRRHVFDPGLAMAARGSTSPIDRLGAAVCLLRRFRTAAGSWLTRIVLSHGSTTHGHGCNNGTRRCDYTHGHHPSVEIRL